MTGMVPPGMTGMVPPTMTAMARPMTGMVPPGMMLLGQDHPVRSDYLASNLGSHDEKIPTITENLMKG